MKNLTKKRSVLSFYCNIFGHNYKVTRKVTSHVKEYTCKCCRRELTTNSNGMLTELTPTYREINKILAKIHAHKLRLMKHKVLKTTAA
jgi:hypothetical protein